MLLIDAIYINCGGALSLLRYLVESLKRRGAQFTLLADSRCVPEFDDVYDVVYLDHGERQRKSYYSSHKSEFTSVLCFGNVPPPVRLDVPVYTYFHNINMLTLADCRDWKQLVKFWLKRTYIKSLRKNTDEWFVQTSNTAKELTGHLGVTKEKVKLYPFYTLPDYPQSSRPRTDYIFVGEYSGSKGHKELLEAWTLLHKQGADVTLHLTVSLGDKFLQQLKEAVENGVRIINHGFVPMEELAGLYMQCKATVYPSYNESFGLGLVEAMEAGCDVIASDKSFVYAICDPSESFDPASPSSIVDAVIRYESGGSRKTRQLVSNHIEEILDSIIVN